MERYIIKEDCIVSLYRGSNRPLAISKCKKGYHRVTLTIDKGKKKTFLVHRLIAQKFIPNPDNLPQVNHIDGNKDNNHVNNLEWVDNQTNTDHAVATGLVPRGKARSNARLSANAVRAMRSLRARGHNYYELGRMFNVAYQTAHKVCTRQTYTHID